MESACCLKPLFEVGMPPNPTIVQSIDRTTLLTDSLLQFLMSIASFNIQSAPLLIVLPAINNNIFVVGG